MKISNRMRSEILKNGQQTSKSETACKKELKNIQLTRKMQTACKKES